MEQKTNDESSPSSSTRLRQSPSFENLMKASSNSNSNSDRNAGLRRSISDSNIALASASPPIASVWICDLCMYENVDPTKTTCTLCGIQREQQGNSDIDHSPSKFPTASVDDNGDSDQKKINDNRRESFDKGNSLVTMEDAGIKRESADVTNKENNGREGDGGDISSISDHPTTFSSLQKKPSSLTEYSERFDDVAPLPVMIDKKQSIDSLTIQSREEEEIRFVTDKDLLNESSATLQVSNLALKATTQPSTFESNNNEDVDLNQMYANGIRNETTTAPSPSSGSNRGIPLNINVSSDVSSGGDNGGAASKQRNSSSTQKPNRISTPGDFELDQLYETGIARMENQKTFPSSRNIPLDVAPYNNSNDKEEERPSSSQHNYSNDNISSPKEHTRSLPPGNMEEEFPLATITKDKAVTMNKRICRFAVIAVVVLIVILSFVLVGNGDDGDDIQPVQGVLVTSPPSVTPDDDSSPTRSPGTTFPPSTPNSMPTEEELQQDFVPAQVDIVGSVPGSRFGTSVSLDGDGKLLAAAGDSGLDAVRVYKRNDATTGGWDLLIPVINVDPMTLFSGSSSVSIATPKGIPRVAIASTSSFRVVQYVDEAWIVMGPGNFEWITSNDELESDVSISGIALSNDGTVLAAGFLNLNKDSIVVRVYEWSDESIQWEPRGDPIIRTPPIPGFQFLSMSIALSGNGQVVSIGDWVLSQPAANVDTYEWTDNGWEWRGTTLTYFWGPAQVSLSDDGKRLGVTIQSPESTHIYEWDDGDKQYSEISSGIAGGTSIAMNRGGQRVVVGRASSNEVAVYDDVDGRWKDIAITNQDGSGRFGASVSVSSSGNVLAIGSPLDPSAGTNAGRVVLYQ